jgi:hypothetical protein
MAGRAIGGKIMGLVVMALFVVLLVVGREELGLKGVGLCLLIVAGMIGCCSYCRVSSYLLITLMALMDIVLLLVIFGSDIRIR